MKKEEAFSKLVKYAQPYITLSTVLDKEGKILYQFHIHPQIRSDCFMELQNMTTNSNEAMLTPEDLMEFADELYEFAEVAQEVIETYERENPQPKG